MNSDDDDLASVNLDAWRVPAPRPVDRSVLFARMLSPAASPTRSRARWLFAALAIANVVLAAILVIVLSQRPPQTIVRVPPAGGGDAQTQEALRRLEERQRALETRLADIDTLRTAIADLTERVRQCEQTSYKTTTRPRPVVTSTPTPTPTPALTPAPTSPRALPESLDRESITAGVASIRALIESCGQQHPTVKGIVKVTARVNASGRVEDVLVASTPDPGVGGCVAAAMRKAIFEPTFHGGAFTYPFVFGASP